MKKLILLTLIAVSSVIARAQMPLYLAGASPYTQNFDALTSGSTLPTGWSVFYSASATSVGTPGTFDGNANFGVFDTANTYCISDVLKVGFKNYPSADVILSTDTCGTQRACTNRALGIRQVSQTASGGTGFDPGASVDLELANTHGMTNLAVSFKLQSLDVTSPRTTTWVLQYGIAPDYTNPPTTWTTATTTGTMTTGGNVFANNSITASFGTALDNVATPVFLRIVAIAASSGSGNRASTGIDDFNLTWTGTAKMGVTNVNNASEIGLNVLGEATSSNVTFGYAGAEGNYNFAIYDLTGRTVHTEVINATTGNQQTTVSGLNLVPGLYVAKMGNGNGAAVVKFVVQ